MENIPAEVTSVPHSDRVSDSRSDPFVNKLNRKRQQTHRPQRVEPLEQRGRVWLSNRTVTPPSVTAGVTAALRSALTVLLEAAPRNVFFFGEATNCSQRSELGAAYVTAPPSPRPPWLQLTRPCDVASGRGFCNVCQRD